MKESVFNLRFSMDISSYIFRFRDQMEKDLGPSGGDIDLDLSSISLFETLAPEERISSSQWLRGWLNSTTRIALLIGEGGAGKSTLLRKVLLMQAFEFISGKNSGIPLLASLHELKNGTSELARYLLKDLLGTNSNYDEVLATGNWLIGLDGITELTSSDRENSIDLIRNFVALYPGARFVLTSRPTLNLLESFANEDIETRVLLPLSWQQLRNFMTKHLSRADFEELIRSAGFIDSSNLPVYNPLFATMALEIFSMAGSFALTREALFRDFVNLQLRSPAFRAAGEWAENLDAIHLGLQTLALSMLRRGKPLLFTEDDLQEALETSAGRNMKLIADLPNAIEGLSATGIMLRIPGANLLRWRHQKFLEYLAASRMLEIYFDNTGLNLIGEHLMQSIFHQQTQTSDLSTNLWREAIFTMVSLIPNERDAQSVMEKIFLHRDCNPLIAYDALRLLPGVSRSSLDVEVANHIFEFATSPLEVSDNKNDDIYALIGLRFHALNQLWNLSAWKQCTSAIDNLLNQLAQFAVPNLEAWLLVMRGRQIYELDAGWELVLESYRAARGRAVESGNRYLRKICDHNIALHEAFDFNLRDPEPVFRATSEYFSKDANRTFEKGCVENSLGILFLRRAKWESAEEHFNTAIDNFRYYPLEQSQVRMNRALLYLCSGKYERASDELLAVYETFQSNAHKQGMCYVKLNQAVLYIRRIYEDDLNSLQYIQSARACIEAANKINQDTSEVWTLATLLQLEGLLLLKEGNREEAEVKLLQSLNLLSGSELSEYVGEALARANLARVLYPEHQDEARKQLEFAVNRLKTYGAMDFADVSALWTSFDHNQDLINGVPSTRNVAFFYLDIIPRGWIGTGDGIKVADISDSDEDWAAIDRILKLSFQPAELRPINVLRADASEKRSSDWSTKCYFWVAKSGNRIVGIEIFELVPESGFAYLWFMAIDPDWRGQGVGSILFQHMWHRVKVDAQNLNLDFKGIVFEVDHPNVDDPRARVVNEDRIHFYENQDAVMLPLDFLAPPFWVSPDHQEVLYKLMVKTERQEVSSFVNYDFLRNAVVTILCQSTLGYREPLDSNYIDRVMSTVSEPSQIWKSKGTLSGMI